MYETSAYAKQWHMPLKLFIEELKQDDNSNAYWKIFAIINDSMKNRKFSVFRIRK